MKVLNAKKNEFESQKKRISLNKITLSGMWDNTNGLPLTGLLRPTASSVLGILPDRFFSGLRTIKKCDSYFQTRHCLLANACCAALQFNMSVNVRVKLYFAANLGCCVFEADSFVGKS